MPSPRLSPLTETWPSGHGSESCDLSFLLAHLLPPPRIAPEAGADTCICAPRRPSGRAGMRGAGVDWSLFGCARKGHVTYAPDEPELRDRLVAPTAGGTAWRCLRCR